MERAPATAASAGLAVVIAWAWNAAMPEYQMPAEAAAGVGVIVQPIYDGVMQVLGAIKIRVIDLIAPDGE